MPKDISFDQALQVQAGKPVNLPDGDTVANAAFNRDGADLYLTSPQGHTIKIEGYFAHEPGPDLVTTDGSRLTSDMVGAFLPPAHAGEYAAATSAPPAATDATPVGKVTQMVGSATITHPDGTHEKIAVGMAVHQGDVIQTTAKGAVDILFSDNTTFAVSENARLSIDEYSYNSVHHSGTSFFSLLQGVFVYTSGLIGKNDTGSVHIETPVGSIGIRGTVIAGDINPAGQDSTVTVVDGSIVVANGGGTLQMSTALETATLSSFNTQATDTGTMTPQSFATTYAAAAPVAATTFDAVSSGAVSPPAAMVPAPETAPQTTPDSTTLQQSSLPSDTVSPGAPAPQVTFDTDTSGFTTASTSLTTTTGTAPVTVPTVTDTSGASTGSTVSDAVTPVATAAAPAAGSPGAPSVGFAFLPIYTDASLGTGLPALDAIPALGINFAGGAIGTISTANFAHTPVLFLNGITSPVYSGPTLEYAAPLGTANTATDTLGTTTPLFTIAGNSLVVNAPSLLTGDYDLTITAVDPVTHVQATYLVTVDVQGAGYSINVGNPTGTSALLANVGSAMVDSVSGSSTDNLVVGRGLAGGSGDTLHGNGSPTGHDILIETGTANVTMTEPAGGHVQMIGLGSGTDSFVLLSNSFLLNGTSFTGDGFSLVDGNPVATNNTLQLGDPGKAGFTFDFTGSDEVSNVSELILSNPISGAGQAVLLNPQDIFEMTNTTLGYTLHVMNLNTSNFVSSVDLSVNGDTYTVAGTVNSSNIVGGNIAAGNGIETISLTATAATNGHSVTLVIDTGASTTAGVSVHIH